MYSVEKIYVQNVNITKLNENPKSEQIQHTHTCLLNGHPSR